MDGKTGSTIVGDGIEDKPGEGVVAFQHVSEHVCGEVAVKRVSALSRPGTETVVASMREVGDVDVQRRLEEDRADGLQVRSCGPEPPWHWPCCGS